jgi:RNA polymerase sigma-70 factor (ECF subfamily)
VTEARGEDAARPESEIARVLVDGHRELLAFVERRVGDRHLAEDILQEAFVRGLEKGGALRDGESAVAWVYRVLRNAVIDHHRRRGAAARALDAFAAEVGDAVSAPPEIAASVCACVSQLAATLKPEYEDALRSIDVDGVAVKDYAERTGISKSNAAVRVFRARQALLKQVTASCGTCAEHGCLHCSCDGAKAGASA